jgi:hypothetical protein
VTDKSWNYPTLGFDPLPGDAAVALSLKEDARIFGQRMTEEAARLERLAHQGWQGEAAEVFAEHLETLPRDLRHCGDAFTDLALALGNYHDAFTRAKTQAADLEQKAAAAKAKLQTAELTYTTPVIQAPDACPPDRDRGPLDAAEDELGQILRDAHEFAEKFNESAEVEGIANAIRRFTEFAPDEPRWNIIKKWAGDVFSLTPVGAALEAAQLVHGIINHYAEFFSDLADFVSDISGFLGLLSIPLLLAPPVGTAIALAAFGLASGAAAMKISLYAGKARDANGDLYVGGRELTFALGDVALNAAGMGGSAKATQALSKGAARAGKGIGKVGQVEVSFGTALADQFDPKLAQKAWKAVKEFKAVRAEDGFRGLGKHLLDESRIDWKLMGDEGTVWVRGGVGLAVAGPRFTMEGNWAGIKSVGAIPGDFMDVITDDASSPDLRLDPPPLSAERMGGEGTQRRPDAPPVRPVMRD